MLKNDGVALTFVDIGHPSAQDFTMLELRVGFAADHVTRQAFLQVRHSSDQ